MLSFFNDFFIFFTEFLNWKSYTSIKDCILKESLHAAALNFIEGLETKFGHLFVTHTLSTDLKTLLTLAERNNLSKYVFILYFRLPNCS